MNLIDETTDVTDDIVDVATDFTAAAADLAIEGAQAALGSRRRLSVPAVALVLIALAAIIGYRRWRAGNDDSK